jgi:DNA-binding transcriptional regulator YiaG
MKTSVCGNCGNGAAIRRTDYPFADMGIPVVLQNIEVVECSHCGSVEPIIPNIEGLMTTIATATVCKSQKLCGEEVKFLRKYVGKSASEFSRFLHVDSTHLSKIENNKTEIGPQLDKLVRVLVANMSPDLANSIQELMEMIPDIKDSCDHKRHPLKINPATGFRHYATA